MKKVSVIVVNYKTPEMTCNCIDSVVRNSKDVDYEIVVVDNHASEASKRCFDSRVGDWRNIKVIETVRNLGYGAGNNLGVRRAIGEYLVFLNSDIVLYENSLHILFDEFQELSKSRKVGFIQPRLYLNHERTRLQRTCAQIPTFVDLLQENISVLQRIRKKRFSEFMYLDWDRNTSRFVDVICGAAMFCRRDCFESIGRFDERFFLYFEEYDICKRAKMCGYTNRYTVGTSVIHLHNRSPKPSMLKKLIYINSFVKFMLKHFIAI